MSLSASHGVGHALLPRTGHTNSLIKVVNQTHLPLQWNPSCEATLFASEKWPFKRGGLPSGVEINTFMFRFTLSIGLSRGGGLSSGWPLKRGSTVSVKMCNRVGMA